MKALVYHGPGKKAWDDVPNPKLQDPTDAIVRVDTTTICGTDLHILKGDVPAVTDGTDPRPRGRRHHHRGGHGGQGPRRSVTG
jgi:threonine dehydrogenase-like Zn-dependent dehydrogenase